MAAICATITSVCFQNICITPKKKPCTHPPPFPPEPLATANLPPVSIDFPILGISYKWKRAVWGPFVSLAYGT